MKIIIKLIVGMYRITVRTIIAIITIKTNNNTNSYKNKK